MSTTSPIQIQAPPAQHPPAEPDPQMQQLREVAQEFEALFINTLLQAMRKTVMETDLFNPEGESKYYRQMHDEELAKSMARQEHGLGMTEMIVNQFAARLAAEKAYSAPTPVTGTEMATSPAKRAFEP
jgi:flagellar protein FlgJ